jgi:very-short-patch-repair endonuclease
LSAEVITLFAKRLRRDATDAEMQLWSKLRAKQLEGIKFRRQEPFRNYILDFVSYEKRLVIELDGGQHAEQKLKDGFRDEELAREGFTVLRFWNHEVLANLDGVLEVVRQHCLTLTPPPSHQGRGEE